MANTLVKTRMPETQWASGRLCRTRAVVDAITDKRPNALLRMLAQEPVPKFTEQTQSCMKPIQPAGTLASVDQAVPFFTGLIGSSSTFQE